jgi:hypothetical protein
MFRYCSSVAFLALLAFSCSSKKTADDDDDVVGTGGGGFQFPTGGASSTGGASNAGGSTSTGPSDRNLLTITEQEWADMNFESCTGWTAEGEMVPANIEFIVDTSGSMTDVSENTTDGRSKWEITRTALESALDNLPRLTSVGMLLWPNKMTVPNTYTTPYVEPGGPSWCVNTDAMVPMDKMGPLGSDHRNGLVAALDAVSPQGGTPMADAYNYAIDNNYGNQPLMPGAKYAVLITDGQPTIQLGCMGTGEEKRPVDYQPVLDAIRGSLENVGVKTFVIGSPGSEHQSLTGDDGRGWLSEAAKEGGTKAADNCQNTGVPGFCHFDMSASADFATGFGTALKNITGQILDCEYKINDASLNGQIVNPDKVNVVYQINGSTKFGDMKLVGKATDPNCPEDNGWYLDPNDASGKTIRLCPKTCERIQQDAGAVIDIRGGCETVVIIA